MKKSILILILLFTSIMLKAQTDGISYQAVIINPNGVELPGVDTNGDILPNAKIAIRFTILDATNSEEYQEVQTTETDLYGRINLIIGQQNRETFALINWDGSPKDLKVEIDFKGSGSSFVDMSREQLTFVPYSYHRNILARGTLIVDDTTDLNGELVVQGPTNLNSTLNVNDNNDTNLSGQLSVQGKTNLKSNFEVEGQTTLNDSLFAGNMLVKDNAVFKGEVDFISELPANFNSMVIKDSIDVDGPSNLNGHVRINASSNTSSKNANNKSQAVVIARQDNFNDYPMTIQGSEQGIAIRVNGSRNKDNNYISFWDQTLNDNGTVSVDGGRMWGRIEGQSMTNLENEDFYKIEKAIRVWDLGYAYYGNAKSGWQLGSALQGLVAAFSSTTGCVGAGACVTAPIISLIVDAGIKVVLAIADAIQSLITTFNAADKLVEYENFKSNGIGVTFSSGAGDYAEWLPKQKNTDKFVAGELVGIKNGMVTKNIMGADKIMAVSTRPFILGNMPEPNQEKDYVKIAFMGQVPVRVIGNVAAGDYILPTEFGSGFGVAIHPKDMQTRDYKRIVGVVWNIISEVKDGLSMVNVAVGLNMNDISELVYEQEKEISNLRETSNNLQLQIDHSKMILSDLIPGFAEAHAKISNSEQKALTEEKTETDHNNEAEEIYVNREDNDIVYFEISNEQIESMIEMARDNYSQILNKNDENKKLLLGGTISDIDKFKNINKIEIKDHFFWQKIDTDPAYKKDIVNFIKKEMDKIIHTHKKYEHKFKEIKTREN